MELKGKTQEKMERGSTKRSSSAGSQKMELVADRKKNGRTLFDRPKPAVGCSANGRRRRRSRNFPHFMEPKGSVPCLQKPVTCPILRHINPFLTILYYFLNTNFNIILPSKPKSLSVSFLHHNPPCTLSPKAPHAFHSHSCWSDHPNNISN